MNPVRVGILGTGRIVRDFHLPALASNRRARVVALGNLHGVSLRALSRDCGIKKTYTDLDLMAQDPEIDAVVNALPHYLHAPVTVTMLQAGKHVLCEKPMAMEVSEARAMIDAAENARRTLMIAHVWRSDADVRALRDAVAAGRLGTVFQARGHSVVAGAGPEPGSWFLRRELAGGGALADVGVHAFDTLSFLFNDELDPVKVWAKTGTHFRRSEVEDTATVMVEYRNAMVAEIAAGWFHPHAEEPHGTIELFGTEGYARTLPLRLPGCGELQESSRSESATQSHISVTMYQSQIDRFLDCILEGREPPCDGRHGLRSMVLLEAAYRSAREGTCVTLAETFEDALDR